MHVLEKTEPSFWREDGIEDCFHLLLDHVIEAVRAKQCPHFWLSEIDLFEKMTDRDVKKLLTLLVKIKGNPSPFIDDSFLSKRNRMYEPEGAENIAYEYDGESIVILAEQNV